MGHSVIHSKMFTESLFCVGCCEGDSGKDKTGGDSILRELTIWWRRASVGKPKQEGKTLTEAAVCSKESEKVSLRW